VALRESRTLRFYAGQMSGRIGPNWKKTGPVDWVSLDAPGYVIVAVGQGYAVHLEGKHIGDGRTFADAVDLVASDLAAGG